MGPGAAAQPPLASGTLLGLDAHRDNRCEVRELPRPLEVTAGLIATEFAEPLVLWGVPNIPGLVVADDRGPTITEFAAPYRTLLAA